MYYICYYESILVPIGCCSNTILDKAIYKELKSGDPAEKLHELVQRIYLKEHKYEEFDRIFHSIDKPVIIGDKNHFDYIKVSINCALNVTKEDVIKNKSRLDEWVLERLQKYNGFLRYNVPISILELTNLVLTQDKRLEYTFSIKKDLLQLQQ